VHNYCVPNALFTLKEYLLDYATDEARVKGEETLRRRVEAFRGEPVYDKIVETLSRIEAGERDLRL
jgi:2-iminoacetate synthase